MLFFTIKLSFILLYKILNFTFISMKRVSFATTLHNPRRTVLVAQPSAAPCVQKNIKARVLIDKTLLLGYMMTRSVEGPVKEELSSHLFTSIPGAYIYRYAVIQTFNNFSTICTVRWPRIKARMSKAMILFQTDTILIFIVLQKFYLLFCAK